MRRLAAITAIVLLAASSRNPSACAQSGFGTSIQFQNPQFSTPNFRGFSFRQPTFRSFNAAPIQFSGVRFSNTVPRRATGEETRTTAADTARILASRHERIERITDRRFDRVPASAVDRLGTVSARRDRGAPFFARPRPAQAARSFADRNTGAQPTLHEVEASPGLTRRSIARVRDPFGAVPAANPGRFDENSPGGVSIAGRQGSGGKARAPGPTIRTAWRAGALSTPADQR